MRRLLVAAALLALAACSPSVSSPTAPSPAPVAAVTAPAATIPLDVTMMWANPQRCTVPCKSVVSIDTVGTGSWRWLLNGQEVGRDGLAREFTFEAPGLQLVTVTWPRNDPRFPGLNGSFSIAIHVEP